VGTLLERARAHADLNAFITIEEAAVLEAARDADRSLQAGRRAPLLGVPLAVKDNYLTKGLTTTFGTSVLAAFTPTRDAAAVAAVKDAGAIVFGKNNLVEMSYGLTGLNEHHGQVKNPYNKAHVTGGSSSGAGASVAARLVPAAFGGDTVGSIRVPASLCGVVGYKPTPGRWPSDGVAPISHVLDAIGLLARNVEDCELLDSVLTGGTVSGSDQRGDLKDVRFAYAPRQHLLDVDQQTDGIFRETLQKLKDAGAELVEVDLGGDFLALANGVTWPIFFHDTMPAIREFLAVNEVPVSFEEIFAALGAHIQEGWSRSVVPFGPDCISEEKYRVALNSRHELRRRLASSAFERTDALLFPTTPCAAPRIENQWNFHVAGLGRDGRLSVAKYAAVELRRGSRNQPADGRERRRASTRSRARCTRRSRPRSARAGSPSRMRSRTRPPTAGHLARLGLFTRCPKVKGDIMQDAINAGR